MSVCGHECHQWAANGLCDWYRLHHQHEAVPHDLLHAVPAMTAVQCGAVRRHAPTGARRAKRPKRTDETVAKSLLPKTTAGMVLHASVQWALCVLTVGQRREPTWASLARCTYRCARGTLPSRAFTPSAKPSECTYLCQYSCAVRAPLASIDKNTNTIQAGCECVRVCGACLYTPATHVRRAHSMR